MRFVQFVDILFFPLVLAGVEKMNIVPGYTESTHFELAHMPYTHSLLASFLWAALIADGAFIVHTPDLPLMGEASTKSGFGLWNNAPLTFFLEAALLLGGLWLYLRATAPQAGSPEDLSTRPTGGCRGWAELTGVV